MPLFLTEAVSGDNPRGIYQFGQGDLLVQGLLINAPTNDFAWAVGAQAIFPTAREEEMGGGKYRLVPLVNFALPDSWFLNLYPSSDIKINLGKQRPGDKGSLFLPLNFMVGKMLTKAIVGSVEIGFPLVHDDRVYDFKMEWRLGYFF